MWNLELTPDILCLALHKVEKEFTKYSIFCPIYVPNNWKKKLKGYTWKKKSTSTTLCKEMREFSLSNFRTKWYQRIGQHSEVTNNDSELERLIHKSKIILLICTSCFTKHNISVGKGWFSGVYETAIIKGMRSRKQTPQIAGKTFWQCYLLSCNTLQGEVIEATSPRIVEIRLAKAPENAAQKAILAWQGRGQD